MTLTIEHLSLRFGAIAALSSVDLAVSAGECLGLLGPNGAGKTTLLNVIGGLVRPATGMVQLDGRRLSSLTPDQVARAGVARTFQAPRPFPRMTVAENVRAGRDLDAGPWLALVGLDGRCRDLAGALTPAEARRLELARALAGAPRVLLLDEPFGGLAADEAEAVAALLERAAIRDRIVILIEHRLRLLGRLCRRAAVLHLGEKIFDGPVGRLPLDPRVRDAYLGRVGGRSLVG